MYGITKVMWEDYIIERDRAFDNAYEAEEYKRRAPHNSEVKQICKRFNKPTRQKFVRARRGGAR